jgi:hypothetical protein
MYSVIDLTQNPPEIVSGTENLTQQECINWILQNGDILNYSILKTI